MKRCPYCAEEIQDQAIVCRFCGNELEPEIVDQITKSLDLEKPDPLAELQTPTAIGVDKQPEPIANKAVITGLIFSVIAAIPELSRLSNYFAEASDEWLSGFYSNLFTHFIINWILWALFVAGFISLWRRGPALAVVYVILILGGGMALLNWPDISDALSGVKIQSSTQRIKSTLKPTSAPYRKLSTPTQWLRSIPTSSPCLQWSQVTLGHVGMEICVKGTVRNMYESGEAYFITFSSSTGKFHLLSYDWYYPDLRVGDCMEARGVVERLGPSPVMVLGFSKAQLYSCR